MSGELVTQQQLLALVTTAFEEWPLYRKLHYASEDMPLNPPTTLTLYCGKCDFRTSWTYTTNRSMQGSPITLSDGAFYHRKYVCNNCGKRETRYFYYWQKLQGRGWFYKVGQFPEIEERVSKSLEEKLSSDDLKSYKNALRMRNFNFGIAAVAYMRRLVENKMSDMLEVLYEAARSHNVPQSVLSRHEEMMKERRFAQRIEYAGDLLPESLRPKGQPNPMAILHELASEGLHVKTDEECVDIFDKCRQTFEYVFGKMRIETEEAKNFVKAMSELVRKPTDISEPIRGEDDPSKNV